MAANLSRATTEHVRVTFTNCTPLIVMTSVIVGPQIVDSGGAMAWIHRYRPELGQYPGCC
ncbi:hypothetical protein DPMN_171411 [Dreissena polymorpha]|uniref:Uncharacterized protein n=1 Tax=Dreissena polymorpha TaxID=45954 RepID=A0A9D4E151_DREPO|nr:hypothetical protein DPMN_171411 [Dreissena polymorpha]